MELMSQNPWLSFLLFLWVIPWKGMALWRAAKKNQKYWFVIMLVINTFAILEILYLFLFSDEKKMDRLVEKLKIKK